MQLKDLYNWLMALEGRKAWFCTNRSSLSTGRWRHGTPLWTTTEFTLFLLQYGLAFVSRESGILVETRFRNFGQRQCS